MSEIQKEVRREQTVTRERRPVSREVRRSAAHEKPRALQERRVQADKAPVSKPKPKRRRHWLWVLIILLLFILAAIGDQEPPDQELAMPAQMQSSGDTSHTDVPAEEQGSTTDMGSWLFSPEDTFTRRQTVIFFRANT